jgi:hypothetical protein
MILRHALLMLSLVLAMFKAEAATVLTIETGANNPLEVASGGQEAIFLVTEGPSVGDGLYRYFRRCWRSQHMTTSDLNFTTVNGIVYVEFVINVNEPGNTAGATFDLESFEVSSGGVSLWNLDANVDYTIQVNAVDGVAFNNGGNDTDLAIYVPVSALNFNDGDAITIELTTSGLHNGGNPDVFAIGGGDGTLYTFPIPEPTTSACLLLGFAFLSLRRTR